MWIIMKAFFKETIHGEGTFTGSLEVSIQICITSVWSNNMKSAKSKCWMWVKRQAMKITNS